MPQFRFCVCAHSCSILCDPMDCSPRGSSVHGIYRQEYWNGLPFPPPGDLPNPGIKPGSPALQADSLLSEPPGKLNSIHNSPLVCLQWCCPNQGRHLIASTSLIPSFFTTVRMGLIACLRRNINIAHTGAKSQRLYL